MFYTERLLLRAIDPEADSNALLQFQNNEDLMWAVRADAPRPATRESIKKFIDRIIERPDGMPFLVICKKPQELPLRLAPHEDLFVKGGQARYPLIGLLNFHSGDFSYVRRDVGFGIAINKAHQGIGYGTEALTWALNYSFFTLGMHRCHLSVMASNTAAVKSYDKIGFVREGLQRSSYFRDGEWHDIIDMAILEDEWRAKRK